ncbi:MAG: carboxypeptidase-like regulatory domain-containing protein [Planctomycetota bacterium]
MTRSYSRSLAVVTSLGLSVSLAACGTPTTSSLGPDAEEPAVELVSEEILADFGAPMTIRGRVVDADGKPVEGATFHPGIYALSRASLSDDEGEFVIGIGEGYPTGTEIDVTVRAPGFVSSRHRAAVGAEGADFVLDRGVTVQGTLTAQGTGTLPREAIVSITVGRETHRVPSSRGRFRASGFAPGTGQSADVRIEGWVPLRLTGIELKAGADADLGLLELRAGATLEVDAVDAYDEVVAGASIEVRTVDEPRFLWTARTDESGRARVAGIPDGVELSVTTTPPEGFGRALTIERVKHTHFLEGRDAPLQVVLHRPLNVTGELVWTEDGAPPWTDEERVSVRLSGSSWEADEWHQDGALTEDGEPITDRRSIRFHAWAPAGTWDLSLALSRPEATAGRPIDLGEFELPTPPKGERSGSFDLGRITVVAGQLAPVR